MRISDKQFIWGVLCVLAVLFVFSRCVHASEVSVVAHTVSYHFSDDRSLHGVNPGVGVRLREGSLAVQAGVFRNSHDRRSVYGLVDWQPVAWHNVTAGLFCGTVNGYPYRNGAFVPVAGAVANLRVGRSYDVRLRFVPAYKDVSAATVALEFGHTFNF